MIDIDAMSAALEPTRSGLDAAGFDLVLVEHEGGLRMTVVARETACEDCLVPKSLFRQMANDEISAAGLPAVELDIRYPIDARRQLS
jgi:hypothetical protein